MVNYIIGLSSSFAISFHSHKLDEFASSVRTEYSVEILGEVRERPLYLQRYLSHSSRIRDDGNRGVFLPLLNECE